MMPNFMNFALNMLKNNPRVSNNPMSQQIISAIQNQDMNEATKIANQICQERGISIEEAHRITQEGMNSFTNFN